MARLDQSPPPRRPNGPENRPAFSRPQARAARAASAGRIPSTARGRASFLATAALASTLLVGSLPGPARAQADADGPPPVERFPGAPPWPKDFEVGLEAARAFAYYFGLVETDSLLTKVTDIGYRLASQSGNDEYLFTFNILDMEDPNALALPGGFIFLTRGILEAGLSDEALAHVLGHEIAHVTERHFARAGRVETLLGLLEQAVIIAAAITAGPSTESHEFDETTGSYQTSVSGGAALAQGAAIFGPLFRQLLVNGYSRGLEVEADQVGRRFVGRAGYAMSGGLELMTTLEDRTYEHREYGYWTTHPLFEERILKARAAVAPGGVPPSPDEVRAYRARVQSRLAALAESIRNDDLAHFLYESALRVGPNGPQTVDIAARMFEREVAFERRSPDILRRYTPIIAEYDSLLDAVHAEPSGVAEEDLRRIRTQRDELIVERDNVRPRARERVLSPSVGVRLLETYLANFPDDSLAVDLRFRLAEQYRLTRRADLAALELDDLLTRALARDPPDTALVARSLATLRSLVPETRELVTNQRLLERSPSDSVRVWAQAQLGALAASLDSLEIGSRFLARYPESDEARTVRERVEALALERYRQARLHESLGALQEALDGYHAVALFASETEAAELSRAGIDRIAARENR